MNLDQLLHFIKVAEYGGFTKAALSLDMSQPALSRSVRQLELDLHRTLFHRHGRGITLTDEGERLLVLATQVLEQLESAREFIADDDSTLNGHVAVGLSPTLARCLVVPLVREFSRRFPRAHLTVAEGLSRSIFEKILGERIHIGLIYDPPPTTAVQISPLFSQALHLFSPARQDESADAPGEISFDALHERPLLFPARPNPIRALIESEATRRGLRLHMPYEVDGIDAIVELVAEGVVHTIGTLDMMRCNASVARIAARRLADPEIRCVVSLVTSQRGRAGMLQRKTEDMVKELAGRLLSQQN